MSPREQKQKLADEAKKRVQLARDVVKQIKGKQFLATAGDFWQGPTRREVNAEGHSKNLQSILFDFFEQDRACEVCAKGAVFLSHVLRYNKVTVGDSFHVCESGSDLYEIVDYFPKKMLQELETLFEEHYYGWNDAISISEERVCKDFCRKYRVGKSDDDWLIYLMKLLIKNKGKFLVLPYESEGAVA